MSPQRQYRYTIMTYTFLICDKCVILDTVLSVLAIVTLVTAELYGNRFNQLLLLLLLLLLQPFYGSLDFVRGNAGEPIPEEAFTHLHLLINYITLLVCCCSANAFCHGLLWLCWQKWQLNTISFVISRLSTGMCQDLVELLPISTKLMKVSH